MTDSAAKFVVVRFEETLDLKPFDCGNVELNKYLKNVAVFNHNKGIGKLYCAVEDGKKTVVGYFVISMARISVDDLPDEFKRGFPRYPIPAGLIGRLATCISVQRKGLGEQLLVDALEKIYEYSKAIGAVFCIVDAKTPDAERFYKKYGFMELKTENTNSYPKPLFLPLEQVSKLG